jgi:hypothetical protein
MQLRGDTRTEHADAAAPQRPRKASLVRCLAGFLAFGSLVLGVVIAARDARTGHVPAQAAGNAGFSTLAPIMDNGRGMVCEAFERHLCEGRPVPRFDPAARRR